MRPRDIPVDAIDRILAANLTRVQMRVLMAIIVFARGSEGGSIVTKDLCVKTQISPPHVSQALRGLIDRGLITRTGHGNSQELWLTLTTQRRVA